MLGKPTHLASQGTQGTSAVSGGILGPQEAGGLVSAEGECAVLIAGGTIWIHVRAHYPELQAPPPRPGVPSAPKPVTSLGDGRGRRRREDQAKVVPFYGSLTELKIIQLTCEPCHSERMSSLT